MKKDTINLVLGLGNYGKVFNNTRHNIGFMVLDRLNTNNKEWNKGEHGLWILDNFNKSILIKPITGMNTCGEAIKDGCEAFNGKHPYNIIVIHDDLDFDLGTIIIKEKGGHGGHKGLESVINCIGKDFIRVRIGIGKPKSKDNILSYVLGKFHNSECKSVDDAIMRAAEAVVWVVRDGINKAMEKFNQREKDV